MSIITTTKDKILKNYILARILPPARIQGQKVVLARKIEKQGLGSTPALFYHRSSHNTITQSNFRGRPEKTSLPYDSHNAYSISPNLSTMSAILDSQSMRETGAQIWNHTYFTISWHVSQRFMTAPPSAISGIWSFLWTGKSTEKVY